MFPWRKGSTDRRWGTFDNRIERRRETEWARNPRRRGETVNRQIYCKLIFFSSCSRGRERKSALTRNDLSSGGSWLRASRFPLHRDVLRSKSSSAPILRAVWDIYIYISVSISSVSFEEYFLNIRSCNEVSNEDGGIVKFSRKFILLIIQQRQ